jgi:hypothetical protein
MMIDFPRGKEHLDDRNCVFFPAIVDGRHVKCVVPSVSLMDQLQWQQGNRLSLDMACLQAYRDNTFTFESTARQLIENGAISPSSEVLITNVTF